MEAYVNEKYLISDLLKLINSEMIFVIPGSLLEILDDIDTSKTKIVSAYHEEQLGYMAIGYYYETKKIPIIIVSQGPGETNLITAISTAYREQIPMLIVSAYKNDSSRVYFQQSSGLNHTPNIYKMMEKITERCYKTEKVISGDEYKYLGNVILNSKYPIYLCINEASKNVIGILEETINFYNEVNHIVDFEKIFYKFQNKKNVGILIGYGANKISEKLIFLAQKYHYYIFTTLKAVEFVKNNTKGYLGHIGIMGNNDANNYLKEKCEILLAFGTSLSSNSLGKWFNGFSNRYAKLIHVNMESTLDYLNSCFYKSELDELNNIVVYEIEKTNDSKSCNRLVDLLHIEHTKKTFILEAYRPNFISNLTIKDNENIMMVGGFGPLGSGISIAVGAALTRKDKRYIVLCGDGGFLFSGMALLNVVKYELPILIVINVNNEYRTVADGQRKRLNRTIATDLFAPNYLYVNKFFKICQKEIDSIEMFRIAYEEFLINGKPTIFFSNDEIYDYI